MNEIEQLTKRWQREREARKTAERILEEKSRELYAINEELLQLATENITKEEWSRLRIPVNVNTDSGRT